MNDSIPPFVPLDSAPGELGRVTRADVIAEARSWLDTPYVHQHREKGHGVDCVGLPIGVCRALGLVAADFDVSGYAPNPDGKTLRTECEKYMTPVPIWAMKPGHVLLLRYGVYPQHMGILGDYLHGGLSLIHAFANSNGTGRVVEHRLDAHSRVMKAVQAYALPGVE